jgi:hypothetical protein
MVRPISKGQMGAMGHGANNGNGNNGSNGSNCRNSNNGSYQQSRSGAPRKPNPAIGKTCHYCKKKPNPKQVKPLLPVEQREFLSKLILNVPEDEQKLYEQLILQNHDVFSKTKDDSGEKIS